MHSPCSLRSICRFHADRTRLRSSTKTLTTFPRCLPSMPASSLRPRPKSSLNTNAFWILQKRRPRQRRPGAKRLNPQKRATQQPAHKNQSKSQAANPGAVLCESCCFFITFLSTYRYLLLMCPCVFFQRIFMHKPTRILVYAMFFHAPIFAVCSKFFS